jgi:vancomycin permeability regulator SanA
VNEDGSLSERLKARLNRSVLLFRDRKISQIVVSGGLGREGYYEGDKMAEYLEINDIPMRAISIDNEGNTTQLTASNFVKNHPEVKSVIVVTQFLHISRTKLAFRKAGVANVYGVHCNYVERRDFISAWHEFLGYYKYLLFH